MKIKINNLMNKNFDYNLALRDYNLAPVEYFGAFPHYNLALRDYNL